MTFSVLYNLYNTGMTYGCQWRAGGRPTQAGEEGAALWVTERLHQRDTQIIREILRSSERYSDHQRDTLIIKEILGSSKKYSDHQRNTQIIREIL